MNSSTQLSNPFSTGGGGVHFEAHVQSLFVILLLSGGFAPCLPCWPIKEIKLQGKIDGFDTDDLIVFVEDPRTRKKRKLLAQVKHSIQITKGSSLLGEVLQAAWNDFKNVDIFINGKDIIVLITGPLNKTDSGSVLWLLDQARHTKDADEFFRHVGHANFSSSTKQDKLEVLRHHLDNANDGIKISDNEFYSFLKSFYLLGYDLGTEYGVALSLLHSHISQFPVDNPLWVWARVVDVVQTWNQNGGTISFDNLPEDLRKAFQQKIQTRMPAKLSAFQTTFDTDWNQYQESTYLALITLIGSWDENNENDIKILTEFLDIKYDDWVKSAREILLAPNSPLSQKNGIWKVNNRVELFKQLGMRVFNQNLDSFSMLIIKILKESNPVFELPKEHRYMAGFQGKSLKHSLSLRNGIVDGLALLGNNPGNCSNCTNNKIGLICQHVVYEVFNNADWKLWGSLNNLIPTLAEAAPIAFLSSVENSNSRPNYI